MDLSTSSHSAAANTHNNNTTDPETGDPELSPLEQEVLDEYAKLAGNLDNVRRSHLPSSPLIFPFLSHLRPFLCPCHHITH